MSSAVDRCVPDDAGHHHGPGVRPGDQGRLLEPHDVDVCEQDTAVPGDGGQIRRGKSPPPCFDTPVFASPPVCVCAHGKDEEGCLQVFMRGVYMCVCVCDTERERERLYSQVESESHTHTHTGTLHAAYRVNCTEQQSLPSRQATTGGPFSPSSSSFSPSFSTKTAGKLRGQSRVLAGRTM